MMRRPLDEHEVDQVIGGTIIISYDYNNICFSSLKEKFDLKNCDFEAARAFVDELRAQNPGANGPAFDQLVKAAFEEKKWI